MRAYMRGVESLGEPDCPMHVVPQKREFYAKIGCLLECITHRTVLKAKPTANIQYRKWHARGGSLVLRVIIYKPEK